MSDDTLTFGEIFKGDTLRFTAEFTDAVTGEPINVDGWKLDVVLKLDPITPDVDSELFDETIGVDPGPTFTGLIEVLVETDQYGDVAPGIYHMYVRRIITGVPDDRVTLHYQQIEVRQ